MHVALAAIAWSAGDRETAESEVEGSNLEGEVLI